MSKLQLVKSGTPQPRPNGAEPEFLKGLNPAQYKAATTIAGPVLIVAGAGSGKTRVLTYRIAYLLSQGVSPHNILALTFTNKAAAEMKERIAKIAGEGAGHRVWAGTFHSVFARVLRSEAEHLGYTKSFTIYDADDALSLIRNIMASMGISQQQFTPQSIRSGISWAKNQMMSPHEYALSANTLPEKQTGAIYHEYEKRLRANNAMDFDDLLLNMIRVLKNQPEVLKKYQELFKYILVDEYQDTNRAQYVAIQLLASGHKNLCVVGDDAQSIYRWRGADIRNILDFQRDYPNAEVVRLEQNYRSTKNILAAADAVIKNNQGQIKKTLWTENAEGDKITVLGCPSDREEAEAIVTVLKRQMREKDFDPKDFAIIYRTNAQSQQIEDSLRRANVPYTIVSGVSFYKRKEVKDTLAYLRLAVNPTDSESLLRIVNEPARALGKTSIQAIQLYAQENNIPLFEAFKNATKISTIQKRAQISSVQFSQLIEKFTLLKDEIPPAEFAVQYIEATGLLRMYKEQETEDALDRWNNIQRLLSHIAEYSARTENPTLEEYLEQIALISDLDITDTTKDHVSLMTLHAAKGLEFPVVFIAGLEQGLFPLGKAENDNEEKEEERRLFYVGITRAREKLFLTYAERRYRFGELSYSRPSEFLEEIDSTVLEYEGAFGMPAAAPQRRTGFQSPGFATGNNTFKNANNEVFKNFQSGGFKSNSAPASRPAFKSSQPRQPFYNDIQKQEYHSQIPVNTGALKVGVRVKHQMFGEGRVEAINGEGTQKRALVAFQSVGRKHLMLQYAKLEVIG
ncbi:MAG TPA: UvrD-helicase domain-containing protein [Patescibacteria group bacterium]|nr:UvrD-helicase domain-containing protein [Patescibacteria group bacterium]